MSDRILDGSNGERVPDHAVRRAHVTADREVRLGPGTDEFHERLLPRTDVGDEEAMAPPLRLGFQGLHEIGVLRKRAPDLAASPGDGPARQLRTREEVPAEAIDQRRAGDVRLRVMKDVEVGDRQIAAIEAFDDLLVLVVAPYRVHRNTERCVPINEGLEFADEAVLLGGHNPVVSGKGE